MKYHHLKYACDMQTNEWSDSKSNFLFLFRDGPRKDSIMWVGLRNFRSVCELLSGFRPEHESHQCYTSRLKICPKFLKNHTQKIRVNNPRTIVRKTSKLVLPDNINHLETSLNTVISVPCAPVTNTTDTVITVSEQFYPHATILLEKNK